MKTKNIIFAILFIAVLYSCSSSSQGTEQQFDQAILVGEWITTADMGNREVNAKLSFTFNNDVFEGKLKSDVGDGNMKNIKFDGKNLSFLCPMYIGNDYAELKGEAVIESGTMTGTLNAMNRTVPFSGTKAK